jgi:alpha-beta hydrolase superfamily lysophospholipase
LSPTLTEETALVLSVLEEPLAKNGDFMKKDVDELEDELRPEYDFSKMAAGVRGKYIERYRAGTNLVLLDPDIARAFPTDASVNEALRLLLQIAQRQQPNNPVGAD